MSHREQASDLILARGSACADDLVPLMPHLTRSQIVRAIQNARSYGLIALVAHGKSRGFRQGLMPAMYGPPVAPVPARRPPSSVWDLGLRA